MADENDNDQADSGLEISDEDAERLLADAVDERPTRATREGSRHRRCRRRRCR
jgi:hypothetical protein